MKQLLQNLSSGESELCEVPCPVLAPGEILIRNQASIISSGTERAIVSFARKNLFQKARHHPQRILQVVEKVKRDGFAETAAAVFDQLEQPFPLGYASAGIVVEVGEEVVGFSIGDRVASNGTHAEFVAVPTNLAAKVPEGVSFESAAFTVLGAIAMHAIRQASPSIGETVAVYGLGLIGQLTVQLLNAAGVNVLGIDLEPDRVALAEEFGARGISVECTSPTRMVSELTKGKGCDAIIVTATSANSNILQEAARMTRQRGRLILVGDVAVSFDRRELYQKEITFQVSCSYGPGRYDSSYETQGLDYPYAYVRWTEQRNLAAVLELMESGKLNPLPLISSFISHAEAATIYDRLLGKGSPLAVCLRYTPSEIHAASVRSVIISPPKISAFGKPSSRSVIGVIGAGNFARRVLLPCLKKSAVTLACIASRRGISATAAAKKFGFAEATTDAQRLISHPEITTLFIATHHHLHTPLALAALQAGKHVFIEKPLAIEARELEQWQVWLTGQSDQQVAVGFNRRFSRLAMRMREQLARRVSSATLVATINAGHLPLGHWLHDPQIGGGRIIGEGCHWIDLMRFLIGSPICSVEVFSPKHSQHKNDDGATIILQFADGSHGTLHYFSSGAPSWGKERIEVHFDGESLFLDDMRRLRGSNCTFRDRFTWGRDKGHAMLIKKFLTKVVDGGAWLIPPHELLNVASATIVAAQSRRNHQVSVIE